MRPSHEVTPTLEMDQKFAIKELARLIVDFRLRELEQESVMSVTKSLTSPKSPDDLLNGSGDTLDLDA